jgi:hypothetical protein
MIGEFLITVFFLLGSIFLFVASTKFIVLGPRTQVGPAFWPQILLGGIIILTIIWLVKFILTKYKSSTGNTLVISPEKIELRGFIRLSLVITLCLAYVFVMEWGGFLLTTVIFQVLILLALGIRKLTTLIVTPTLLTGVLFGIFIKILHIPLPRGAGVFHLLSSAFY